MKVTTTTLIAVAAVLLLCNSAHGQQTTFKGYHLGEDFATWATADGINMDEMCTKPKRDKKAACQRLERIRGGEELDFSTTDGKSDSTFYFRGGMLAAIANMDWMIGSSFQDRLTSLVQK